MVKNRDTVVLYTTGVCNLRCRYCGIDKNPVLKEIDNALEESFKTDYYFEQIKKYFPNRGQLKKIETWGGEPFLRMDRIHNLLRQIIEYYPYYTTFFSSTNFSYDTWINQVFDLFKIFNEYPDRDFRFGLQLSCDGPEYINDAGRGQGTTARCLVNFNKFKELIGNNLPSNVELHLQIKATMDLNNLKKLNTKEKIVEYYRFFEDNFVTPIRQLGYSNISINSPVPNFAVPAPATKEDGIYFANYCKMCREIEKENRESNYNILKEYDNITMFSNKDFYYDETMRRGYNFCGTGDSVIGLLPDNMVSSCHEGFVHFVEKYKKYAATSNRVEYGTINFDQFAGDSETRFCLTETEYQDYEWQLSHNCKQNASAYFVTQLNQIITLAMAGLIDEKYLSTEEAVKATHFYMENAPCVKDNYNITGSITTSDYGLLKLFFNGAFEYIIGEKGD